MSTKLRQVIQMAASTAVLVAGLWLIVSPFALGRPRGALVTTMNVTFGALIMILAYFRVLLAYRQPWVSWINVAFGILVLASPWIMGFPPTPLIQWHHVIVGLIVIVFATGSALLSVRPRPVY
jgi:hypothetical protein